MPWKSPGDIFVTSHESLSGLGRKRRISGKCMISPEIPEAGFQEESLFHAARQLSDAVAQEAFLEAACRNQPELRRRLDALLAAERAASRLLDGLLLQPRPHANLAVGGRLGDYELLGEIGRGGMGMVYRARQISTGRVVALKVIGSGSAAPTARISRFQIEAQAASQLTHPNIVRILEVGSCDGVWFFSMELIEGEALSERIKREASQKPTAGLADNHAFRDESVLIEQFCTIVHAVQYAHERGVLHRDLKPANILVDQAGEPHLIDFGLAKVLLQDGSPTRTADVMGTPSHMAPEQARGRSCSVETDVYGLGAILYELLTGRPPFHADSPVETLRQVIEQAPVHPSKFAPGVDASLALICLRCLEKEPRHRYPSAAALAADLERWLRHESILTRRASLLVRAGRWARRNPLAASFIATLAVGLGVMGGLLLQVNREKNKQAALAAELRSMNRESVRLLERAVGMVRENLESLWAKGERTSMLVGSEEIAALANRPVPTSPLNVSPTRYVLGLTAEESPTGRAQRLADLLAHLENQLGHQLRRPVRMDVRFYKFVSDCRADLCAGKLDIARLGALPYLRSRGEVPELQPIVVPIKEAKIATLFSRADSDIKSVDDLRGRRVAFGETNSTVSFRAQMELAQTRSHGLPTRWLRFSRCESRI